MLYIVVTLTITYNKETLNNEYRMSDIYYLL